MKHIHALSKSPQLAFDPGRIDQILLLLRLFAQLQELGIFDEKKGQGS